MKRIKTENALTLEQRIAEIDNVKVRLIKFDDNRFTIAANDEHFFLLDADELQCKTAEYEFRLDDIQKATAVSHEELSALEMLHRQVLKDPGLENMFNSRMNAYIGWRDAIIQSIKQAASLKQSIKKHHQLDQRGASVTSQ